MKSEKLVLENISIRSGGILLLDSIDIRLYLGEIAGITCDNIRETETIYSLFRGECTVYGNIRFKGSNISPSQSRTIFSTICSIVNSRQSGLIDTLSIEENLEIFADPRHFLFKTDYRKKVASLLQKYRIDINLLQPVSSLTFFQRIQIEILKACIEKKEIIVLYRLYERLSENDKPLLYKLLSRLTAEGYSFIILDTPESDLFSITDRITVIKSGTTIGCFDPSITLSRNFIHYMLNGTPSLSSPLTESEGSMDMPDDLYEESITFHNVSTDLLHHISISIGRGELFKILCLDDYSINGFRKLITEGSRIQDGFIRINGKTFSRMRNGGDALRNGIFWCPPSPYNSMLLQNMSVRDNIMIGLAAKVKNIWLFPRYRKSIDQYIQSTLGNGYASRKVSSLSADLRQIVAYSRILLYAPHLVILDRPYSYLDPHIKQITTDMINRLLDRGISVIVLISSLNDAADLNGDAIYVRKGTAINEEEMYQEIYQVP